VQPAKYIHPRNGIYWFRMAVPVKSQSQFGKPQIQKSLNTRCPTEAQVEGAKLLDYYTKLFRSGELPDNDNLSFAQQVTAATVNLSLTRHTDKDIAAASTTDSIEILSARLLALKEMKNPTAPVVAALAGAVEATLSLDDLFVKFKELSGAKWSDLDEKARRKKWLRYQEPITDFKREIGDLNVLAIKPKDAFQFAVKLGNLIEAGKIKSETAKRKLLFMKVMVRKVFQSDYPDLTNPFDNATIDYSGDGETRKPFTEDELKLVTAKMGDSKLNDQARAVLEICQNTGAHASEVCLIEAADLHLDAEIPYMSLRPNANRKSLKTNARPRDVPLIGVALDAARRHPSGFSRYCRPGGPDAFTQLANKFIQSVVDDRTTYSLRHRLIDLLRVPVKVPGSEEKIQTDAALIKAIVGHSGDITSKYGFGYSLTSKYDALKRAIPTND
jgi:integrase